MENCFRCGVYSVHVDVDDFSKFSFLYTLHIIFVKTAMDTSLIYFSIFLEYNALYGLNAILKEDTRRFMSQCTCIHGIQGPRSAQSTILTVLKLYLSFTY